jgi:hypothetical protein
VTTFGKFIKLVRHTSYERFCLFHLSPTLSLLERSFAFPLIAHFVFLTTPPFPPLDMSWVRSTWRLLCLVLAIMAVPVTAASAQKQHALMRRSSLPTGPEKGFRTPLKMIGAYQALTAMWEDLGIYTSRCMCDEIRNVCVTLFPVPPPSLPAVLATQIYVSILQEV